MANYGFQFPVYKKPEPDTIIKNVVFKVFVGIGAFATGIGMFNKRKAAKAKKRGCN